MTILVGFWRFLCQNPDIGCLKKIFYHYKSKNSIAGNAYDHIHQRKLSDLILPGDFPINGQKGYGMICKGMICIDMINKDTIYYDTINNDTVSKGMIYRKDRYGNTISELGFGCMRFTKNAAGQVDIDKAESEVKRAFGLGVNYYDMAYVYPGIETAFGKILARNDGLRDKINIATKLPHYLMKTHAQIERTFREELSRIGTDHIDYYLMHMLTDLGAWERVRKLGIEEFIAEKKKAGEIRQIGFSFHGPTDEFIKILDSYDWDFCQIQYNYMDENSQAGRRGLEYAEKKGIPVIIMEPLRGGRLVNLLPQSAKKIFAEDPHGWSPAEWGLRWLYNQSGVTCVLSGMNSIEMVEENCRIASAATVGSFGTSEEAVLKQVRSEIAKTLRVPCTGCSYCMPCPHGVDIPGAFRCWNEMYTESKKSGRTDYYRASILRHDATSASLCVKCGRCEKLCPQSIPIRKRLSDAAADLETPWYKVSRLFVKLLHLW